MKLRFLCESGIERVYHRDKYWKDWFDAQSRDIIDSIDTKSPTALSYHVYRIVTGQDDRQNHGIEFPRFILAFKNIQNDENKKPFEVQADDTNVYKCVVRTGYSEDKDISIVFKPGVIVTAWLNPKDDVHKSLNPRKYAGENDNYGIVQNRTFNRDIKAVQ